MNKETISALEPGKELDQAVATAIGYVSLTTAINPDGGFGVIPRFSTDIDSAWNAVTSLGEVRITLEKTPHGITYCAIGHKVDGVKVTHYQSPNPSEAICKALLLYLLPDEVE